MKNLKKVLCLALAFAMVLGLCVSGLAAKQDVTTLSDWNEVTDKGAATLLNAFSIMNGDADGNFYPDKNVSRAEAAAMLSRALWGGKDDVSLYNGNNVGGYTDVISGNWYMGYINYMTVQKIMKGDYGTTNFRPNGNVTGYELLKMCLVSLGYDPSTEGLEGAGWDINTMALATAPNFLNLTRWTTVSNWNEPLSRMNAARIIANMLDRQLVEYSLTTGVAGSITSQLVGKTETRRVDGENVTSTLTFGEHYLGMETTTARLVANSENAIVTVGYEAGNATPINVFDRRYAGENAIVELSNGNFVDVKVASTAADVGKMVNIYTTGRLSYTTATKAAFVYAAVQEANEVDPTFFQGAMTNADQDINGVDTFVVFEGTNDRDTVNAGNRVNGRALFAGHGITLNPAGNIIFKIAADKDVKFLDTDGDKYIDTVIVTPFASTMILTSTGDHEKDGTIYMENNTKWDAKKYDANKLANCFKASNCNFEMEVGDHAAYIPVVNCFNVTVRNGYVLEAVEGKINRVGQNNVDETNQTNITIDGVKYVEEVLNNTKSDAMEVGAEGTFYLWNNGKLHSFVAKTKTTSGPEGWALVYDAGYDSVSITTVGGNKTAYAEIAAVLPDGTDKVFAIGNLYTTNPDTGKVVETKNCVVNGNTLDALFHGYDELPAGLGNAETDGILGKIKNGSNAEGETIAALIQYSLNSDGTINLYNVITVTDADNDGTMDKWDGIEDVNDVTAAGFTTLTQGEEFKSGTAQVKIEGDVANGYMSANTVTYTQVTAKGPASAEKWVVTKGVNGPSYKVAADTTEEDDEGNEVTITAEPAIVALTARYGIMNGVSAIMLPVGSTDVAAATANMYYITDEVEQLNNKAPYQFRTSFYDSTINDIREDYEFTAMDNSTDGPQGSQGLIYTKFSQTNGFDGKVTADLGNSGIITLAEGNTIHVSTFANEAVASKKDYVITDKTSIYVIDGEDTHEAKFSELTDLVAADAAADNAYNVIVVKLDENGDPETVTNHGEAILIVAFAENQTLGATEAAKAAPTTMSAKTAAAVKAALEDTGVVLPAGISMSITRTEDGDDGFETNEYDITLSGEVKATDYISAANTLGYEDEAYQSCVVVAIEFGAAFKNSVVAASRADGALKEVDPDVTANLGATAPYVLLLAIDPENPETELTITVPATTPYTVTVHVKAVEAGLTIPQ